MVEEKTDSSQTEESLSPQTGAAPENGSEATDGAESMDMAALLAQEEASGERVFIEQGALTTAVVVSILEDGVLVDVGQKAEVLIPRSEFGETIPFAAGETIPVLKLSGSRGGTPRLSWRAARDQMAWQKIEEIYRNKESLNVKVKSEIRGGLLVECDNGLTGFVPASQVDVRQVKDLKRFKGQTLTVYISEYDSRKNNLVLSRRMWLAEINDKKKTETLAALQEGEVRKGVVTSLTSFGAFVDIGGVEGLLHIGELEWARTQKVSDVLKVGQQVDVKVLKFDAATGKISLSRKELLPHPWDGIEARFPVGGTVEGKVVSITDFGAFLELAPQVEGLLHSSEMTWDAFAKKPQDVLKVGEKIQVKVIHVNRAQEKISLSLKRTQESPWAKIREKYPTGSVIKVTVSYLVPFGAFARLPDGLEGLIHISDFYWSKRIRHPEDVLKVGQELDVKVLDIDADKEKISLGLKQTTPNPYEIYSRGKKVAGTVKQVTESGAVVELEHEAEGFIPRSEASTERFDKLADILAVGARVEAKVIAVDAKERKISLSVKQLDLELQRAAERKYSGKTPRPKLGELFES